ncbi:peroxiredoxin-like family protein [Magnetospirillum sulfuroxidans]|uniref:AhpC/TSA family protein n=1 Tax=Magnetospirillum sulfuroxidans TaxID=611300 RepID=A0ABS5IHH5_9PROT|nr:peroxiredoxin-like family protein [Magnetospirillum sulfuroxidans]MBR9973647.1 AhpC/TSA family protein [Magnetospirillum sulfuroxidans]
MLMPRHRVPALSVPTIAHGLFDLAAAESGRFTMVVFYRGLHCPICLRYLAELERLLPEFDHRGVAVIAVSTDSAERAAETVVRVKAQALRIGYGLPLSMAREWGLYLSAARGKTSIGIEEPALFSEPGLFLVRPDGSLYYGATQTMPFARPSFAELLTALDFVIANDYPARGEYSGEV